MMWMAEGVVEIGDKIAWNHTAGIMGLLHNVNYKKPVGFDHYNPHVKKKSKPNTAKLDKTTIGALKSLAQKGRGLKSNG